MKKFYIKNQWLALTIVFVTFFSYVLFTVVYSAKPDKTLPSAPTNLRAVSVTDTTISLAWDPSTDNAGVAGYNIYRDTNIDTSTICLYTSQGLMPSKTHSFYVVAKDAYNNLSNPSNTISMTTFSSTPASVPTVMITPLPTPSPEPTATSTPTTMPSPTPTVVAKKIVGYYGAWAAYSGYTPDKLDVSKLTHINYAFANVGSDLKIALGYPDIDPSNFSKLNALKQINSNIKILISVGGYTWSGSFSDVAYTDTSREVFADSCVAFIVKYGLDGVDIDWEYPVSGGLSTNVKRPEDKQNFTLLVQKLREKLDARGIVEGKHYLITIAGANGSGYLNNIELGNLRL